MLTSGLVITLNHDRQKAHGAIESMQQHENIVTGELDNRWLPIAIESKNRTHNKQIHNWLDHLTGVDHVDVVHIEFNEE